MYEIHFFLNGCWSKTLEDERRERVAVARAQMMLRRYPNSYKGVKVVKVTREVVFEGLR